MEWLGIVAVLLILGGLVLFVRNARKNRTPGSGGGIGGGGGQSDGQNHHH